MDFGNVIIMTDIDGTLLTDGKKILPKDMDAINHFRSKGGTFTLATGRGYSMAKPVADKIDLDVPAVVFNGSAVYDFSAGKFLWHSELNSTAKKIAIDLTNKFPDIGMEILCEETVYIPIINGIIPLNEIEREHLALENVDPAIMDIDEMPQGGWLKILTAYPPESIQNIIDYVYSKSEYLSGDCWVKSERHYFEMLPEGVNKGSGFKRLLEILGREDAFTVGIGDYNNDVELIRDANLGAAVASAQKEAKDAADIIVCDNNSGAVAEVIEYIEKL